jgi:hypothetical protein
MANITNDAFMQKLKDLTLEIGQAYKEANNITDEKLISYRFQEVSEQHAAASIIDNQLNKELFNLKIDGKLILLRDMRHTENRNVPEYIYYRDTWQKLTPIQITTIV